MHEQKRRNPTLALPHPSSMHFLHELSLVALIASLVHQTEQAKTEKYYVDVHGPVI
jgi:hypothetical protein